MIKKAGKIVIKSALKCFRAVRHFNAQMRLLSNLEERKAKKYKVQITEKQMGILHVCAMMGINDDKHLIHSFKESLKNYMENIKLKEKEI